SSSPALYLCLITFNSRGIAGMSGMEWSRGVAYQGESDPAARRCRRGAVIRQQIRDTGPPADVRQGSAPRQQWVVPPKSVPHAGERYFPVGGAPEMLCLCPPF